jgi:hypothetical protein
VKGSACAYRVKRVETFTVREINKMRNVFTHDIPLIVKRSTTLQLSGLVLQDLYEMD